MLELAHYQTISLSIKLLSNQTDFFSLKINPQRVHESHFHPKKL